MVLSSDATGYYVRRLRLPIVTALLVGLLLAAAPAVVVRATTFCVNTGGTGGCFSAIGAAVGNASDGDTITVASGTYHEHDITIVTSIAIIGSGGPILDAGGLGGQGFIIQGGADVGITGLTVQGGSPGIVINAGSLSLVSCWIRSNNSFLGAGGVSSGGGGISNSKNGDLTLSSTTVSGNNKAEVSDGGGILNLGTLTMENSAIQSNTALEGGGVSNSGAMTMTNSSVKYNRAKGGGAVGGGIANAGIVTITNGSTILGNVSDYDGGGIFNVGTLIVDNSAVGGVGTRGTDGNTAGKSGGGIFNDCDNLLYGCSASIFVVTIRNHSRVINNAANGSFSGGGGGIYSGAFSQTTVTGSTIGGNTAHSDVGGGISSSGTLTVTNSTVISNTAGSGGGISSSGTLTVMNSTVSGNTSLADGGGIDNGSITSATLTNTTLSGNSAAGNGGGFNAQSGAVSTLTNVTVSGNRAAGASNGLYRSIYTGTTTLKNTLVADGCTGTPTSGDYNLDSGSSCGFSQPHDLKNTNPLLGPLQVNAPGSTATQALLPGSPAVDRGGTSANGCPTTDQRGVSRPQGSACDIGAYELIPPRPVPPPRPGPVLGPPPPAPIPPSRPAGVPASGGPPAPIPIPRR